MTEHRDGETDLMLCTIWRSIPSTNIAPIDAVEHWINRALAAEGERDRLRKALERIERWFGEFPPSGRKERLPNGVELDNELSYGAAFGSNGERDYMRGVARSALYSLPKAGDSHPLPGERKFDRHAPSLERLRELHKQSSIPDYMKTDEDF